MSREQISFVDRVQPRENTPLFTDRIKPRSKMEYAHSAMMGIASATNVIGSAVAIYNGADRTPSGNLNPFFLYCYEYFFSLPLRAVSRNRSYIPKAPRYLR